MTVVVPGTDPVINDVAVGPAGPAGATVVMTKTFELVDTPAVGPETYVVDVIVGVTVIMTTWDTVVVPGTGPVV